MKAHRFSTNEDGWHGSLSGDRLQRVSHHRSVHSKLVHLHSFGVQCFYPLDLHYRVSHDHSTIQTKPMINQKCISWSLCPYMVCIQPQSKIKTSPPRIWTECPGKQMSPWRHRSNHSLWTRTSSPKNQNCQKPPKYFLYKWNWTHYLQNKNPKLKGMITLFSWTRSWNLPVALCISSWNFLW